MRHARSFNPEWAYVAPAPSHSRTDCLIVLAAIIFATAGVATISLLYRPVGKELVAARTFVAPEVAQPMTADTSVAPQQPTEPQEVKASYVPRWACGLPPICRRAGLGRSTVRE
jgi:hypothetical protein